MSWSADATVRDDVVMDRGQVEVAVHGENRDGVGAVAAAPAEIDAVAVEGDPLGSTAPLTFNRISTK